MVRIINFLFDWISCLTGTRSWKVLESFWKVWHRDIRFGKCWYCDHLEVIVRQCHVTWEVLVPWSGGGGNTLVAYHFFAIHILKLLLLAYQLKREPFLNRPAPPHFSAEVISVSKARGRFRSFSCPGFQLFNVRQWGQIVLLVLHRRRLHPLRISQGVLV